MLALSLAHYALLLLFLFQCRGAAGSAKRSGVRQHQHLRSTAKGVAFVEPNLGADDVEKKEDKDAEAAAAWFMNTLWGSQEKQNHQPIALQEFQPRRMNIPVNHLKAVIKKVKTALKKESLVAAHKGLMLKMHGKTSLRANEAATLLSGLLLQVEGHLDEEHHRCKVYEASSAEQFQYAQIELGRDKGAFFKADSKMQALFQEESRSKDDYQRIQGVLKDYEQVCKRDAAEIRTHISDLHRDADIASSTMKASPCASGQASVLLECGCRRNSRKPRYTLRHRSTQNMMMQLQSRTAKKSLRKALAKVATRRQGSDAGSCSRRSSISASKRMGACTIVQQTDCSSITEAMILMAAEVHDREQYTMIDLSARDTECHKTISDYASEVEHFALRLGRIQGELATITSYRAGEQEEIRLKQAEFVQANRDLHKFQQQCVTNVVDLEGEMCSLRQMRTEVYEADGVTPPTGNEVRDCEVTPWVHEPCSVTCGGGVQKLSRRVVLSAGPYGMACPELETTKPCAQQPCPIDCKVSPWGEWSPCSVLCGGGTRTRLRSIRVHTHYGGEPCPIENAGNEQCGTHSCDSDCTLSVWSSWSECSRGCGGGFKQRRRDVATPAVGHGFCPTADQREDFRKCNAHACIDNTTNFTLPKLQCNSKIDLAVVLEAGGGGDAQQGFSDAKDFLKKLFADLLPATNAGKVKVAMVSAGGPQSWESFLECEQGTSMDACNVKLEFSFTDDVTAATSGVDSMQWPGAPSHTAGALSLASTALSEQGRMHAHHAILVVARGEPLSVYGAGFEADRLKRKYRLMWLLSSPDISVHETEGWASHPIRDNILHASLAARYRDREASDVLSALCPNVEVVQSSR